MLEHSLVPLRRTLATSLQNANILQVPVVAPERAALGLANQPLHQPLLQSYLEHPLGGTAPLGLTINPFELLKCGDLPTNKLYQGILRLCSKWLRQPLAWGG